MNQAVFVFMYIASSFLAVAIFVLATFFHRKKTKKKKKVPPTFSFVRAECNPILSPQEEGEWEREGTFNPAAVVDDEGTIHVLYRAIGGDGKSRLGYIKTTDGISIDEKSQYPVYESDPVNVSKEPLSVVQEFNPSIYTSGGGWYGCEDPRGVLIDGRVYVTYTAFGGWHSIRIALTSISLDDLKQGKWNWKRSRLISPEGETNKNWVLFPEKVHGKFAVLHSLYPKVLIDYVDTLESLEYHSNIKSIPPRGGFNGSWDNAIRGAGPPPIKTKDGWLLFYHAMDKHDPNKYKVGAMLLDLKDPTIIKYKAPHPLLSPDMHYENDYKPGVVYLSGAVIKEGSLYLYYGGGDKHLCVAETKLDDLLSWLKKHGTFSHHH